jgi:hypothetical protein
MYRLSAPDEDLYFFEGRSDVMRCTTCGTLTNKWNEDLGRAPVPHTPKHDIFYSYDGVLVTSARFQTAVIENSIDGLEFRALGAGLFFARPLPVVHFDTKARETRLENQCPTCGNFESVTGAIPVFLKPGSNVAKMAFARTDLEFGTRDAKAPLVLCGDDAVRRLKERRLRGLTFVESK